MTDQQKQEALIKEVSAMAYSFALLCLRCADLGIPEERVVVFWEKACKQATLDAIVNPEILLADD